MVFQAAKQSRDFFAFGMKHVKIQRGAKRTEVVGVAELFNLLQNCRSGRFHLQDYLARLHVMAIFGVGILILGDGRKCRK